MRLIQCTIAPLVACLTLVVAQPAAARQPGDGGNVQVPVVVSIDFAGGTLREYLAALAQAAKPNPVNAVAPRQALEATLGPITLRDVTIQVALNAIQPAAGVDSGHWGIRSLADGPFGASGAGSDAYAIEYSRPQSMGRAPSGELIPGFDEPRIQVFSLREIIEPQPSDPRGAPIAETPEVVLTAIQAALDLSNRSGVAEPELKFHADSGLLIIRGNAEQVKIVNQSIDQLEDAVRHRRNAARQTGISGEQIADLRAEVAKAEVMLQQRENELAHVQRARALLEAQQEAGTISTLEVETATARVLEVQAATEMARIELLRLKARLDYHLAGMESRVAGADLATAASASLTYDLAAFGDHRRAALSIIASVTKATGSKGTGAGPASVEPKGTGCIVTGSAVTHEAVRVALEEFARASGVHYKPDDGKAPGAGTQPAPKPKR